ncbi:uncharacterized protein ACLA_020760 [Aspergillus clavatus NRRL 1]|uniref:Uncharacterized protein n=1 Tax=Aspergillus clavatus (strain ATCC 1007 / CBS 513.65 / DSM 816 / NCTC 3887 / NRRL 1 / QM 1276 / 107) TaxID=344612 RepID=A1CNZ8_ASPCL|nr:uncharacterized protein ACLA_020760 [Aspergillus clavatus NRRL 1]EAW07369.1 hypothetical protein ACLA_020760 [Aspergillus clavatus NRRL 1]
MSPLMLVPSDLSKEEAAAAAAPVTVPAPAPAAPATATAAAPSPSLPLCVCGGRPQAVFRRVDECVAGPHRKGSLCLWAAAAPSGHSQGHCRMMGEMSIFSTVRRVTC